MYAPMLHGTTWAIGNEFDRKGTMTRFVAPVDVEPVGTLASLGIGVGQQDLYVRSEDAAGSLFGLGSVEEIMFPLDLQDPRFDEKASARGIDPGLVRRRMGEKTPS